MATRLQRSELLDHPSRDAILQLIEQHPGIPFLELHHRLKAVPGYAFLGYGSLLHHLQVMEKFGLLTTRKAGRFRRHYAYSTGLNGSTTAVSVLQTEPIPTLVGFLLEEQGQTQKDLWRKFANVRPCSRQTVGYHLQRLESLGLLTVVRVGAAKAYYATEKLLRLATFLPTQRGAAPPAAAPSEAKAVANAHVGQAGMFGVTAKEWQTAFRAAPTGLPSSQNRTPNPTGFAECERRP